MPDLAPVSNPVTDVPAASSARARAHFKQLLEFETDCWDVHDALNRGADVAVYQGHE